MHSTHSVAAAGFAGLRLNMLAMDGCLRSLNLCMHAEDRAQGGCVAGASTSLSSATCCQDKEPAGGHFSSIGTALKQLVMPLVNAYQIQF